MWLGFVIFPEYWFLIRLYNYLVQSQLNRRIHVQICATCNCVGRGGLTGLEPSPPFVLHQLQLNDVMQLKCGQGYLMLHAVEK